ncbi:MAG TPA: hypothetical protein VL361_02185 [Candidatus Limnocylindrales bacterium]|nr:hypothetical protein [Candidatus Limnocylindrales bacterium]
MFARCLCCFWAATICALAEPHPISPTNSPALLRSADAGQKVEQIRTRCIEGRRYIAGRVLEVTPDGLVIDSGYSRLLSAPFNKSWLVTGTATIERDPTLVEENKPDAICSGLLLLSNFPKRPAVKNYDYVVIHGYPAGNYVYVPAPGIKKTIRRFSASLERAVESNQVLERK